jgi:hypothetical protein
MRKLKSIITILAISLSTIYAVNATEVNPSKTKVLRTEIVSILGSKISIELNKSSTAEISFIINNQNEIVIISVDSNINKLNTFIKSKLNYKKVDVRGTIKGEIYKIPLTINVK